MKNTILCIAFSLYLIMHAASCYSQQWKQQVNFTIDVTLNGQEHTLDGFEKIEYINNSPDTLHFIWFHLWANAYKNDQTAYSEQLLSEDFTDFYFSGKEQKGYINRLDFKVNGATARMEDHPSHIDIARLVLPMPLAPGAKALITTPFHVQVPYNFSGNGYKNNTYKIMHWYPVPALYDASGWHTMPFTGQKDTQGQPGNYAVNIHIPYNYKVTAPNGEQVGPGQENGIHSFHFEQKDITGFAWSAARPATSSSSKVKGKPVAKQIEIPDLFSRLFDTSKTKDVSLLPGIGYNLYDGIMPGLVVHNYLSAQHKFRFVAAPLYGTKSGTLNGIARASYNWDMKGLFKSVEAGTSVSKFSSNKSPDDIGESTQYTDFFKVAPFIRFTFKENQAASRVHRYVQLKHFYIREESFEYKDVINGTDTSLGIGVTPESSNITQLKLVLQNTRKLYPYSGELIIEKHKDFVRAGFTGNYYFNYADNINGLHVRLFAGKLFYSNRSDLKSFLTQRYHLNLSGVNGEEDYTYSNYFIGRNEFDGLSSQQIMIRDGAFKVRTDLLSDKVGKTDDWLTAINFTTNIPDKLNPLSILPIKIPLKIFADLGTYAEAWDRDADAERFLFDAGLQVSLFHETINIYVPVVSSKVFRDYNKSYLGEKKFLKTISFSIDFRNLRPAKYTKFIDL